MTDEEIAAIAAKHRMAKFPNLALTRERLSRKVKEGNALVYDADLSSYFDTIPHDKLLSALEMRIADGSVLNLIRQWLKACAREPNGVMVKPKGRGTPQGGVISPLLSNIYLHWFETITSLAAKAMGQAMSIVRYADDFVILAKNWAAGFLRKVESILNVLLPVDVVVDRVNKLQQGWGAFYSVGCPSRVFRKVNHYVLRRMARFLNRKSQRYYRLKFADSYYGELAHYGLHRLAWADVRRAR